MGLASELGIRRVWTRRLLLGGVLLCLLVGLWGCGGRAEVPPQAVVERAIALRLAHVQQRLIAHLSPAIPQTPNFKLRQVIVTDRQPIQSADPTLQNIYQVNGTYEALIQLPSRQTTESGQFEVYVQTDIDDTTDPATTRWYLAEPNDTGLQPYRFEAGAWERTALAP